MATAQTEKTAAKKDNLGRRTLRKIGRKKTTEKLKADPEFAKAFFDGKSKRSAEKKVLFRKKKQKK